MRRSRAASSLSQRRVVGTRCSVRRRARPSPNTRLQLPPALAEASSRASRAAFTGEAAYPSDAVIQERIREQFERRAAVYDHNNTYHPPLGQRLLGLLHLQAGETLLDLAAGTGIVALPAAAAVGPAGRVVALDLSPAMLAQTARKAEAQALSNLQLLEGDMEDLAAALHPGWSLGSFDAITCSAAVPFLRHPHTALASWRAWLKPGGAGRVAFNTFVPPALEDFGTFLAMAPLFGLSGEADPCDRLGSVQLVTEALESAGYSRVEVAAETGERWMPAPSLEVHACKVFDTALNNNPFRPVVQQQQRQEGQQESQGDGSSAALAAFREAFVASVVSEASAAGRWNAAKQAVRNTYTVLHVLAHT